MADNEAIVVVEYSMAPSQKSDGRLAGEIWTTSKPPGTHLVLPDMANLLGLIYSWKILKLVMTNLLLSDIQTSWNISILGRYKNLLLQAYSCRL